MTLRADLPAGIVNVFRRATGEIGASLYALLTSTDLSLKFAMTYRRFRSGAVLALCVALAPVASAGEIYKYRDADGIIHYTDKRPGAQQSVEIFQLFGSAPEQQHTVFIEKRGNAKQDIVVVNQNQAPVEVDFHLTQQDNVRSQSIPAHWVVPANSELKLASLQPVSTAAPLRYDYQMRWQLGVPDAHHNEHFADSDSSRASGNQPIR